MGDGLGGVNSSLAHRDMQRMQRMTVGKGGVNVLLATGCMLMLTANFVGVRGLVALVERSCDCHVASCFPMRALTGRLCSIACGPASFCGSRARGCSQCASPFICSVVVFLSRGAVIPKTIISA